MKGIVVEINRRDAVILSEDGIFTKVKNNQFVVGQKIDTGHSVRIRTKWAVGAASTAAVLMISTAGVAAYNTPTDYISLDVNPSIEYTINRFDRILDTKAVNDEGEALLDDLDFENMKLQEAMKKTLDILIEEGYLSGGEDSGVVITTSNEKRDDAEKLANNLKTEMQNYLSSQKGITAAVKSEAIKPEKLAAARELGVSPGKLNLVEKLQESTAGAIDMDEWLDKPVKEINQEIKKNHWLEREYPANHSTHSDYSMQFYKSIPEDQQPYNSRSNTQGTENKGWKQLEEKDVSQNSTSSGAGFTPGGMEIPGPENPPGNQPDSGNRWDRNNGRFNEEKNDDQKEHNQPDWKEDQMKGRKHGQSAGSD